MSPMKMSVFFPHSRHKQYYRKKLVSLTNQVAQSQFHVCKRQKENIKGPISRFLFKGILFPFQDERHRKNHSFFCPDTCRGACHTVRGRPWCSVLEQVRAEDACPAQTAMHVIENDESHERRVARGFRAERRSLPVGTIEAHSGEQVAVELSFDGQDSRMRRRGWGRHPFYRHRNHCLCCLYCPMSQQGSFSFYLFIFFQVFKAEGIQSLLPRPWLEVPREICLYW